MQTPSISPNEVDQGTQFEFPSNHFSASTDSTLPSSNIWHVPETSYNLIYQSLSETCESSSQYPNFKTNIIPSLETMSLFVNLYFCHCQPVMPFIHVATFDPSSCHWLLILAVATVGSHFIETQSNPRLVGAMHEFLRRTIQSVVGITSNIYCKTMLISVLAREGRLHRSE